MSRGNVVRYDGAPVERAVVSFATTTTTRTTAPDGYFEMLGGVRDITKDYAGHDHWVFKRDRSDDTLFIGAYAKRVLYQQAAYDITVLANFIPVLGQIIDFLVDVKVGAKFYEDLDDLQGETDDATPSRQWVTVWARGYAEARVGLSLDIMEKLHHVSAEAGTALMLGKEPDHDPDMNFDGSWAALSSSVLAVTLAEISPDTEFRSGKVLCSAGLSTTLLSADLISGTAESPAYKTEVSLPTNDQGDFNAALTMFAIRSVLPASARWLIGQQMETRPATSSVRD